MSLVNRGFPSAHEGGSNGELQGCTGTASLVMLLLVEGSKVLGSVRELLIGSMEGCLAEGDQGGVER